jgi:hypothetical protein
MFASPVRQNPYRFSLKPSLAAAIQDTTPHTARAKPLSFFMFPATCTQHNCHVCVSSETKPLSFFAEAEPGCCNPGNHATHCARKTPIVFHVSGNMLPAELPLDPDIDYASETLSGIQSNNFQ